VPVTGHLGEIHPGSCLRDAHRQTAALVDCLLRADATVDVEGGAARKSGPGFTGPEATSVASGADATP
jgi:hypothetical protein